jgi:UDP-N-acetylmuramoyl-tripeptide--D-alanyl-D-alanine ligase
LKKYNVKSTQGNFNNHIGVPLTLLSFDEKTEFGIVEMGANHPGEIEFLCNIAQPNYGIITNIGKAHLEGFGNQENIIETKTALYRSVNKKNGLVFVNIDDEILINHPDINNYFSYGKDSGADYQGHIDHQQIFSEIILYNSGMNVKSKLVGAYNAYNILAAACIGHYFKIEDREIKNAVENYEPSNNRSQLVKTERNQIIMDAYNANPSSMSAALGNFTKLNIPGKILILGDMLELGEESEKEHKSVIEKISKINAEKIFLVGKIFADLQKTVLQNENILYFDSSVNLYDFLIANPLHNKNILIKGSRGIKLEKILNIL